jgi:hypothetical protein
MSQPLSYEARVRRLRDEFDRGFAEAARPELVAGEMLLWIMAGGERLAIPLREIAIVSAAATVTPVAAAVRGFAGFAVAAGHVTPVYDLAVLLDLPGSTAEQPPLIFAAADQIAFAVGAIGGQVLRAAGAADEAIVLTEGTAIRLVALDPLIRRIEAETRAAARRSRR